MSEPRLIKPLPGPQMLAAKSTAKIVVFGGSAGSGKSFYAAWRAARFVHIPGYNAIIFRRTFPMLRGGGSILQETYNFYPDLGGVFNQQNMTWTFPSGATVELKHLQHEKDAHAHRSKAYCAIFMDEATEFEGSQFFFMLSRLRSTVNVFKQFTLTCNPDPDSFLRPLVDWWIGEDGYPIPERAGVVRHWVRVKDEIVWADTPDELLHFVGGDPLSVMSFTFIPSKIYDNTVLMAKDPGYLANLKSMVRAERDRYLGGNWNSKVTAGDMFQRSMFKPWGQTDLERALQGQDGVQAQVVSSIRVWDFASTPVTGDLVPDVKRAEDFKARDPAIDNPDWTVSIRLDRTRNGRIIITDATFNRDTPGACQELLERLAMQDGPRTTVGIFRDPGQAGEDQAERLARRIRRHAPCVILETSNKDWHAREPARAAWRGDLYYFAGRRWENQFFNQLEGYPDPSSKDDAVVALAGGYRWMVENPISAFSYENPEDTMRARYDAELQNPALTRALYAKKARAKRGIEVVRMNATRGWARKDY